MSPLADGRVPACAHWLLASPTCGAIVWDPAGWILAANPAALRLLAIDPAAWIPGHLNVREAIAAPEVRDSIDLSSSMSGTQPLEYLVTQSGGITRRLLVSSWPLPAPEPLWASICADVTPPAGHELDLEVSAARLELLYQRSPLMYFTVAADGRVLSVNRTALDQLGLEADAVVDHSVMDVFHADDRDILATQLARCFREPDRTHTWDLRKLRRNGEIMWVTEWARVVPGLDQQPQLLVVCEDISARKRAEQALRDSEGRLLQAQKQEALGRLAGGIAHDFSNLLTVVLGHCDAARMMLPRDSPALDELQGIREAAQQATNLSRQLLTFSRRQVVQPAPLQLDDVVTRMTPLFRRLLGPTVRLEVAFLPGMPQVFADPGQIEQVLTNLIVNARDAIEQAGTVRITSSLVSADDYAADTGMPPDATRTYICVSIRDDGVGMDEEVQRRAFEPFFTTKADDRGTGLGLPTVQSIVTQAGGGVSLHTAESAGCDVRVYLPTVSSGPAGPVALPEPRPLPGGQETILLVEDREAVRRVAQRFLSRRGYRVIESESAELAMDLAAEHAGEIDLLLSDVVLGHMDGQELATRLVAQYPGLKVVLMSGYPSEMLTRAGQGGPVFPFVSKPIDFPTLAQLLRDLLDARPRR
ncbi:MAG: PAS domain S-box protein [Acidobacteria bacterium]|nr:PAS domain S-box protein [Acidobacteriota bacterium]